MSCCLQKQPKNCTYETCKYFLILIAKNGAVNSKSLVIKRKNTNKQANKQIGTKEQMEKI